VYQSAVNDPLADTEQCKLNTALMKELGVNAIPVDHVDLASDHNPSVKLHDLRGNLCVEHSFG
jgi:1,3-beta-glucanosyltransferase GAS1